MSLLDALFLDPVRINIWISKREDNAEGTGTQQDPYSGNTQSLFDAVMRDKVGPNTCVHLGPGIFETAGYHEGISGSWELKPGMRIVGSGMDVTILKRVNNANQAKQWVPGSDENRPGRYHGIQGVVNQALTFSML